MKKKLAATVVTTVLLLAGPLAASAQAATPSGAGRSGPAALSDSTQTIWCHLFPSTCRK